MHDGIVVVRQIHERASLEELSFAIHEILPIQSYVFVSVLALLVVPETKGVAYLVKYYALLRV